MRRLTEVLLICCCCCCVVSSSRSTEDVTPTLATETAPTTMISTLILQSTTTTTPASTTTTDVPEEEKHKPSELPVDLLSSDKVLLDPNVVLARVARDTYGGWGGNYRQSFSNPNERRPFGYQEYYNPERAPRPDRLKRRNDVRKRSQVAPKRFRVYPVFPG